APRRRLLRRCALAPVLPADHDGRARRPDGAAGAGQRARAADGRRRRIGQGACGRPFVAPLDPLRHLADKRKTADGCPPAVAEAPLRGAYLFSSWRLSAAPRMSPSEAPESVEPYWATASFSSAISSALIDTVTRPDFLSSWVMRAST